MTGPLAGIRIIEIAGIGPGPFCAMMLSDMGAEVLRVDRSQSVRGGDPAEPPKEVLNRGRRSVALDLKHPDGLATLMELVTSADGLIEGFRPGVAERLGFGPAVCAEVNPRLVFGRMTGWGQEGPYAQMAGHDINYIALGGALYHFGRKGEAPVPPINLVGDFGGGGMLLAFGMVCGLLEAQRSGQGQVVDAAMVDGSAVLMSMLYGFQAMGFWDAEHRGTNMLDTGSWYYDVYETKDGGHISLGSLEPQFYAEMVKLSGLEDHLGEAPIQNDRSANDERRAQLAALIATKTRDEWCEIMEGSDACFAPVLSMTEAHQHPHNQHRGTFVHNDGVVQPAPAPRFSRTAPEIARPPAHPGQHTDEALADWGIDVDRIAELRESGAIA